MRVLTVFGTRPEVIKLAPVIQALKERGLDVAVCVSGQHRDMVDQMLSVFDIRPDYDLDIMQEDQSPLTVASRIFEQLVPVFARTRADWLLVQGDTTTTFAAAWVSFHQRTPIGHIEAGLRTGDKFRPFPEEMNRRLTSSLGDLHFAPTPRAVQNLLNEGVPAERIFLTGNTVVDALQAILRRPVVFSDPRLAELDGRVVLVTAHRRESFGPPLEQICGAVTDLVNTYSDLTVVLPVHRNPSVRKTIFGLLADRPRTILTDPLPYPEFVHLMSRADLILSDSGGVQEEAPSLGTPVLVLREITERPEAVEAGWAELVGTRREAIVAGVARQFARQKDASSAPRGNPFGDGTAGKKIVDLLLTKGKPQRASTIGNG
jgi:UDP-N-acetylglucosamine 2-epimerase (non-hydrolysing)